VCINPLPSDRLRCCDRYIRCQRSLAVKLLTMYGSPSPCVEWAGLRLRMYRYQTAAARCVRWHLANWCTRGANWLNETSMTATARARVLDCGLLLACAALLRLTPSLCLQVHYSCMLGVGHRELHRCLRICVKEFNMERTASKLCASLWAIIMSSHNRASRDCGSYNQKSGQSDQNCRTR